MVWAKTKLTIYEYIREPDKDSILNFSGKNILKFYHFLKKALIEVTGVGDTDIHEMGYTWEKKDGQNKFKVEWRCVKEFDDFTHLRFDLNFRGECDEKGEGSISLVMKPRLITEYPQDTILQQSIFYEIARTFWHNTFYQKKRWQYLVHSREIWTNMEKRITAFCEENH